MHEIIINNIRCERVNGKGKLYIYLETYQNISMTEAIRMAKSVEEKYLEMYRVLMFKAGIPDVMYELNDAGVWETKPL